MANAQMSTLVLKDAAGNYFLVPQETLEQGRVLEAYKAELEQLIASVTTAGAGGDDVQGYVLPAFALGFAVGGAAVLVGYGAPEVGRSLSLDEIAQQMRG